MRTPTTFDDAFSKREGLNTNKFSDNELQDIVTIVTTLDAMGDTLSLVEFFDAYKDNFLERKEYMKVSQLNEIEYNLLIK